MDEITKAMRRSINENFISPFLPDYLERMAERERRFAFNRCGRAIADLKESLAYEESCLKSLESNFRPIKAKTLSS
jgi:hypothetical protein